VNHLNLFKPGEYYPPVGHEERIERYRKNKLIFEGKHSIAFDDLIDQVTDNQTNLIYISVNLPKLICNKSADFLFGETPTFSAGKNDDSSEQLAIERLVDDNHLNITNYESAVGNSYRGDSFYKIRWGQKYNGLLPKSADPFRIMIQPQKAEYVFIEFLPGDSKAPLAYHIAYPQIVEGTGDEEWVLNVESHYPGLIKYSSFSMTPFRTSSAENKVLEWKIEEELEDVREDIETGVSDPLIVHIPNYSTDDDFFGTDDLTENESLFFEINNRLTKIAEILDKHSDPAMAVPQGTLGEDENGQPIFHAGRDKMFEVSDKEQVPKYITWDGQLEAAFRELELLLDQVLTVSEIPPVALGKTDSGTSGSSGLSIKWRMNSLLSKINRKRQYYDKGLKQVILLAQKLEHAKLGKDKLGYEVTAPKIKFKDGLPDDELEQSTIANTQTGGKPVTSQLTAIMRIHGYTEAQARIELDRIRQEQKDDEFVSASIFNDSQSEEEGDN
jgi:hypothetical protein